MLYVSPSLTMLMLAVVPPVSLGAVCRWHMYLESLTLTSLQVWYGRYIKKLSNQTQEAIGEMTKVCLATSSMPICIFILFQVATESLSALRTVQAYNAHSQEELKFHEKVNKVIEFARKEAIASGIFFGSTRWSGNVTLLCLLGYGKTYQHL